MTVGPASSGAHHLPARLTGVDLNQIVDEAVEKVNKRFNHLEPNIYKNSKWKRKEFFIYFKFFFLPYQVPCV